MAVQRNLRPALLALLCVLVVALGAATLDSSAPSVGTGGSGSGGIADGGGVGVGGQNRSDVAAAGQPIDLDAWCVPFLRTTAFGVLVAAVALLVGGLLYRSGGALFVGAGFAVAFAPALVAYLLLTDCGSTTFALALPPIFESGTGGSIFQGAAGGGSAGSRPSVTPAAVAVLAIVAVAVGVAFVRATDDDVAGDADVGAEDDADPDPEDPLGAMGAAAGAAADRIDAEADVENEVFRAWREMTAHLDVSNPASSTPAEFADAARDAGMASDDVDALTDLFREVRYGGERPTADREERAVAALRSIEDAYAGASDAEGGSESGDAERGSESGDAEGGSES